MAKQKNRTKHELESLIPTIKNEERRLDDLLGDERARSDRIVRDAEAQAAALIESARKALPGMLQAERDARRAALVRKADEAARVEGERTQAVEKSARAAMERTVAYIVSLVWPVAPNPPSVARQ
jgi:vacuolar-type H+-ATPase subunit H